MLFITASGSMLAIHMIVELEGISTIAEIAKALRLTESVVYEAIDFLKASNVIDLKDGKFIVLKKNLHIDNQSSEITHHHRNLRFKAMEAFPFRSGESLYFSSFLTYQKNDIPNLRKKSLVVSMTAHKQSKPPPPEGGSGLNIDFYQT